MKISEVKTGNIVYWKIRPDFIINYKVIEPAENSILLELIQPSYLGGLVRITAKDFEKFYKKES